MIEDRHGDEEEVVKLLAVIRGSAGVRHDLCGEILDHFVGGEEGGRVRADQGVVEGDGGDHGYGGGHGDGCEGWDYWNCAVGVGRWMDELKRS